MKSSQTNPVYSRSFIAAGLAMWVLPQALAADWQPATGPLKTRWAKDVSPANVLPDYPGTANINDLTAAYERMLAQAWELNDSVGLAAVIYTQLTDLEKECNGLWTYDREVNKVIVERAAAANAGKGRRTTDP